MTPEIRTLWLLTVLFLLVACVVAVAKQDTTTDAITAIFGPVSSPFTTRRIPARDFLCGRR